MAGSFSISPQMTTEKPIPLVATVQVLRWRPNPSTQVPEPWPVATIEIDAAGRIGFSGDAGVAYEPLLRATQKAASRLAQQTVMETLQTTTHQ